jgi:glucose/arabinose dehydrogenase
MIKSLASLFLVCAFFPSMAQAEDPQLMFAKIASRTDVVDIANAGDGSGRLFLVEQPGRIFIVDDGEEQDTPFLDIRDRVTSNGNEQGLLSVAFAPDYKASGYFYVWYTADGGETVLSRFKVSNDPDMADPGSEQEVLEVEQPFGNHNGGRLQFGPDGMLYLGLGDGGGAFDPENAGQDGSTLLAKLIRIDVDPSHGTYAVPADNPFTDNPAIEDEIWALGLRNPWRISFDRMNGDLYIADVGQSEREEINVQAASSTGGQNYGWSVMEGSGCTGGGNVCDQSGLTLPVSEYNHEGGNCSVTGGEVYRGQAYPNMHGMYFFGDYCTGKIWGLMKDGNDWITSSLADTAYRNLHVWPG